MGERPRRMSTTRNRRSALLLAIAATASPAAAQLPSLTLDPAFPGTQVTALRLSGPQDPAGVTGLAVLPQAATINHQTLAAGTLLASFGSVSGGEANRVYAVDPLSGAILPDLSVSYGPGVFDGKPDAGLLLLPGGRYLSMQYAPMAVVLAQFEADGPGRVLDSFPLPTFQFPNGGGIGFLDDDTIYVTSWNRRALWRADFAIAGDDLSLSNLTQISSNLGGPGPDGVAIIPPNAAGELRNYAGNLILARFSGFGDGYVDVIDTSGNMLQRLATYHRNAADGVIGPDGLTFAPDGTLFVGDFDQTIFRIESVPEPATLLLLAAGAGLRGRRRQPV
ncbi:MAG: hypothetical protein CHACPFDD_01801 [Phycisphaerae bacterium]|nr:hypothetical protein [Phycisphaerae bacterium]